MNCIIFKFRKAIIPLLGLCIATFAMGQLSYEPLPTSRNVLKWPFSVESIWNTPIGSNAQYVHAQLELPTGYYVMTIDEDYIVMCPDAPLRYIYESDARWDSSKSRCNITGGKVFDEAIPLPDDFVVSPENWSGGTPNSGAAILMSDRKTIVQTQPFARCKPGEDATSYYTFEFKNDDKSIYGNGYYGAHGGSYLSAIGGTLRVGELTPTSGPIRHALKVNVFSNKNLYYNNESKGFRWPALTADSKASVNYGKDRKNPIVKDCRMGALLALPPDVAISSYDLETEPGKILAQAFQDYGAYIVDDTAWDVNAIATEWGPDGRFKDEFKNNWGFDFSATKDSPFANDMQKIFANLHVVVNNQSSSIGGGGIARAPLAPPFDDLPTEDNSATENNPISVFFDSNENKLHIKGYRGQAIVFNMRGEIVKQISIPNGSCVLQDITPGFYLLQLDDNQTYKFQKK